MREWAESFCVAFALALAIKLMFFEIYKIPTSSMEPTLIGKMAGGDRIIVNKLKYRFSKPRRWDVFVFHSPIKDKSRFNAHKEKMVSCVSVSTAGLHMEVPINTDIDYSNSQIGGGCQG